MAKKAPPKEKPQLIEIIQVTRTRRFIRIHYKKGDEDFKVKSNQNPLVDFDRALDALLPLVCTVCEVPKEWNLNLRVMGLTVGAVRDAKTVSIRAQKSVTLSGAILEINTPAALLTTPNTEGAVTETLAKKDVGLVEDAIEEAKRYVKGERAQGELSLEGDDDDDEGAYGGGDADASGSLPFPEGDAGTPAKKTAK